MFMHSELVINAIKTARPQPIAPILGANSIDSRKLITDVENAMMELYLTSFSTYDSVVPIYCVIDMRFGAIRATIT